MKLNSLVATLNDIELDLEIILDELTDLCYNTKEFITLDHEDGLDELSKITERLRQLIR